LVAEVEDLSEVELEAQVLENYLDHVKFGTLARIELPSLPGLPLVGTVTAVRTARDERSRNFPVKIRLKNKFDEAGIPS